MSALTTWARIVMQGLGPGAEIWQTGLSVIAAPLPGTQAALQTDCNALEPFFNTFWGSLKSHIYSSFSYTGVKMYAYSGAATRATLQAQTLRTAVAGTLVANSSPIDTSLVASLRTAVPGRSGRGRMYLPCHDVCQPTSGNFVGTASADYALAVKTLANAIAGYSSYAVAVVSRTTSNWELVRQVIADNRPDVQRRRENKIIPSIVSSQVIP